MTGADSFDRLEYWCSTSCALGLKTSFNLEFVSVRSGESYRLQAETIGIVLNGNSRTTIMIPKGSIVTVRTRPLDGAIHVDVEWNWKEVSMFGTDLGITARSLAERARSQQRPRTLSNLGVSIPMVQVAI